MNIPRQMSKPRKGISSGKRLNSKPTYIVAGIVLATLYGIYHAASSRSLAPRQQFESAGEEMLQVEATPTNQIEFIQDRPDGLAGVDQRLFDPDEATETGRVSNLDERLLAAYEQQQLKKMEQDNALRERMMARQIEMAQAAIEGDTVVDGFGSTSEFARQRRDRRVSTPPPGFYTEVAASAQGVPLNLNAQASTTEATKPVNPISTEELQALATRLPPQYQQLLSALINTANNGQTGTLSGLDAAPSQTASSSALLQQNLRERSDRRDFRLRQGVEAPRTRFEIKTGTILPAAMISAANSDLPGDIVAQITQNVYDTQTGKYLLIPQGTKLFGRYDAFTQLGQERLLIVWDRLIFPDAETLDIGGMQGYDGVGQAGFQDQVNTHFVKTLFNALLISLVNASGEALVSAANNNVGQGDNNFLLNLSSNFGEVATEPFDEYLRNRLRIKPTLHIRSGYRFNVMVSKDISLDAPYRYGYPLSIVRP